MDSINKNIHLHDWKMIIDFKLGQQTIQIHDIYLSYSCYALTSEMNVSNDDEGLNMEDIIH